MKNKKYCLPEREWFSLEGAIKEIKKKTGEELEIIDLLHFWLTGRLEINIEVKYTGTALKVGSRKYKRDEDFKNVDIFDTFNSIDDFSSNKYPYLLEFYKAEHSRKGTEKPLPSSIEYECSLHGLFYLVPQEGLSNLHKEVRENKIKVSSLRLKYGGLRKWGVVTKEQISVRIWVILNPLYNPEINLDDLCITKDHLEQFLTGETNINLKEEREKFNQPKPISKPVQENQIAFIKTLLFMHYGVKTAEEARQLLRNSGKWDKFKREHAAEIEALNLKIPSDNTLQNWYRNS